MASNAWKRTIRRMVRHPALGVPAAIACDAMGARAWSRKISRECDFVPPVVEVDVPADLAGGAGFRMDSAHGRDQVARSIWFWGWGSFEKPMPDLFGACSRHARHILDVGAYSGFYSLLGATCNREAEVLAFEPFPLVRETLIGNVARNGLSGRVRVIPAAVSDLAGTAEFYVPPNQDGWIETASSLDSQWRDRHEAVLTVDVVTLDAIRHDGPGFGPVDLIKIDAEQVEHRVLDGGRRLLAEDRPIVFLEIIPGNRFCPQIEAIREEAGYAIAALHRHGIDWRDQVEGVDIGNPYASNQVLCPAEKVDSLEGIARSLGYRVSRMEIGPVGVPG